MKAKALRLRTGGSAVLALTLVLAACGDPDTTDDRGEYALNHVTPGKQLFWVRYNDTFFQMEVDLPKDTVITLPGSTGGGGDSGGQSPAPDQPGAEPPTTDGPGGDPPAPRPGRTRLRNRS
jgi:hypothetical protein